MKGAPPEPALALSPLRGLGLALACLPLSLSALLLALRLHYYSIWCLILRSYTNGDFTLSSVTSDAVGCVRCAGAQLPARNRVQYRQSDEAYFLTKLDITRRLPEAQRVRSLCPFLCRLHG